MLVRLQLLTVGRCFSREVVRFGDLFEIDTVTTVEIQNDTEDNSPNTRETEGWFYAADNFRPLYFSERATVRDKDWVDCGAARARSNTRDDIEI
jgi:hypothetical protein